MGNDNPAALDIWEALRPKVEALLKEKTQNCVRAQRAVVVTAPDSTSGKIVVQIPFDTNTLSLPYSSAVANVAAGTQVWVLIPNGEALSNGVVVQNGSWQL